MACFVFGGWNGVTRPLALNLPFSRSAGLDSGAVLSARWDPQLAWSGGIEFVVHLGKFHGVRGNTTRPSSVSGWSIGWEVWTGVGGSLFIKEAEDSGGGGGCEAGEDRETAKSTCREGTRDDAKEIFCASRDWPHRS